MSLFLLDTDTLTLLEHQHAVVIKNVSAHPSRDVNLSAISVQEQMQGFLAAVNRARDNLRLGLAYELLVMRLLPFGAGFLCCRSPGHPLIDSSNFAPCD